MSRGGRLAPLVSAALILSACGGKSGDSATTTAELVTAGLKPPVGCYLTVFLVEDVTKAQTVRVQNQLLANKLVTTVSFVSKELELRRFAQRHPLAAQGFAVNPFTDRFEVVPRTHGSMFSIIGHFATHGGPITNVTPTAACGQPS